MLVRHLRPLLRHKRISSVEVRRLRILRPILANTFRRTLIGARIVTLRRRGKYLLFEIQPRAQKRPRIMLGHLGMTGRMYLLPKNAPLPKHAAVVLGFGDERFIFEDTRYFGRLTFDAAAIQDLGPEPLSADFNIGDFGARLARSVQPVKVKLLDQSLVAGIGNIYACEALFRARISPGVPANRLNAERVLRLWRSIRTTLTAAIQFGSTVPLDYARTGKHGDLFYYGQTSEHAGNHEERLWVYDREGQPCRKCRTKITRIVQAARSTFYCPRCQRA